MIIRLVNRSVVSKYLKKMRQYPDIQTKQPIGSWDIMFFQ